MRRNRGKSNLFVIALAMAAVAGSKLGRGSKKALRGAAVFLVCAAVIFGAQASIWSEPSFADVHEGSIDAMKNISAVKEQAGNKTAVIWAEQSRADAEAVACAAFEKRAEKRAKAEAEAKAAASLYNSGSAQDLPPHAALPRPRPTNPGLPQPPLPHRHRAA